MFLYIFKIKEIIFVINTYIYIRKFIIFTYKVMDDVYLILYRIIHSSWMLYSIILSKSRVKTQIHVYFGFILKFWKLIYRLPAIPFFIL